MGLLDRFRSRPRPPRGQPDYHNESVVQRIMADEGVDRETANRWFGETLVFLDLCAASDHVLSPPEPVDKAWHAFVLHTRDYDAYCRERFGKLIHHQPSGEPDPTAYRRAFDRRHDWSPSPDPGIWMVPAVIGDGSPDSGSSTPPAGDSPPGEVGQAIDNASDAPVDFGGGDSGSASDSGGGGDSGGSSCGGSSCGSSS
jgi:hypothetical protein